MRHVLDTLFADEAGTYMQRIAAQPHIYEYVRRGAGGWHVSVGRCLYLFMCFFCCNNNGLVAPASLF